MDHHELEKEAGNIQIVANDEQLKGRYANLMSVSHTGEEFVLDFFMVTPSAGGDARGALVARILTSPAHFKRIVAALEDNLKKYEAQFGEIEEVSGMIPDPDDIGFIH